MSWSPSAWTRFRGSDLRTGSAPGARPLVQPELLWEFDTGGTVESSPTVVGGLLYCGTFADHLLCLDAESGEERYRFSTGGAVFSSPAVHQGDGLAYVGSDDHHLHAVEVATGRARWRTDLGGRVLGSPALVEHQVIVGGEGAGGELPGALFALDRRDGAILWRFEVGSTVWSSPTVVGDRLWFGAHDGRIRCLVSAH